MLFRKSIILTVLVLVLFNIAFAGDLIKPEASRFFKEALKQQKANNFEEANLNYDRVFLVDPNNTTYIKYILNNRGLMYYAIGDIDRAEELFNEALAIDPNYKAAKENLGFIYEKKRTELESIKYWMKLYNINIDSYKPKGLAIEEGNPSAK